MWGLALSVADNLKDPFWNWIVEKATGRKIANAPVPSDLHNLEAYYLGRVVGDILSIGISLGESAAAIIGFLSSIAVGGGISGITLGTADCNSKCNTFQVTQHPKIPLYCKFSISSRVKMNAEMRP
jgi:hypothetical protein